MSPCRSISYSNQNVISLTDDQGYMFVCTQMSMSVQETLIIAMHLLGVPTHKEAIDALVGKVFLEME